MRLACRGGKFFGIVEKPLRDAIIWQDHVLFTARERKGPTIFRQKISAVKIAGVYAFTTEHAADRNWAEIPEEIIKPA